MSSKLIQAARILQRGRLQSEIELTVKLTIEARVEIETADGWEFTPTTASTTYPDRRWMSHEAARKLLDNLTKGPIPCA